MRSRIIKLLLKSSWFFRYIWFLKEFISCLINITNLYLRGYRSLTHQSLCKIKRNKGASCQLTILGSGPTINELSEFDFEKIDYGVSFSVGRWFYNDYVPDILFLEFKSDATYWVDSFIAEINKLTQKYEDCVFVIEVFDKIIRFTKN